MNKAQWAAPFKDSQRSLRRKLRNATFCTLSVKWVAWPTTPVGYIRNELLPMHQTSIQFGGTGLAFVQPDEIPNAHNFSTTWTGLAAIESLPMMPGFANDDLQIFAGYMNGMADQDFTHAFDMNIEPFTNHPTSAPGNPRQGYLGDSHTFS
jgi:hypothetical protein